ncbi:hypothetical protein [Actinotalea solisilvae]|uniref:hypothetical protein n=1 Tax=Actinotalea solisilvae TaxID=2072922 RepID=UPI0018F186D1|nr:hypothetical protein [Actinotalea solisilvae]
MTTTSAARPAVGRARVAAARALAVLGLLVWWIGLMGPIDLTVPIFQPPMFEDAYLVETGWGLLYTVLLGVPTIALAIRPRAAGPALQVLTCAGAIVLAALVSTDLGQLVPAGLAVALVAGVRALVRAAPGELRDAVGRPARGDRRTTALAALAVIAVVPTLVHLVDMAQAYREDRYPVDITQFLNHWPIQGAFAVAVVGLVALAAVTGRRTPAVTAGVSAAWFGVVSVLFADQAGGFGRVGGAVAVVWGVAVVAAAWATGRAR